MLKPWRFISLISISIILLTAGQAEAWSINTHVFSADRILEDIEDGAIDVYEVKQAADGTFTRELLGAIPVDPVLVAAIKACPKEFRAGACSADGYPDMYVGQSIIHPYEPGQRWRATDWARHVKKRAAEMDPDDLAGQKALAFSAGWLVHYAGDAFGHTWVNRHAGGAWDWGDMNIVLRHIAVESYLNSRLPGVADGAWKIEMDMDPAFIRDALMLDEEIRESLITVGYLHSLVEYYEMFRKAERKCERKMDKWWNPVSWAIGPVELWLENQRKEASRALYEWAETSNRAMRYLADGNPLKAMMIVNAWIATWAPKLCLGIPQCVMDVIGWLGAPIDWIMDPVSEGLRTGLRWIWQNLISESFHRIVNPEVFVREVYGDAIFPILHEEFGLTDANPFVSAEEFIPLHDTIVLGKLTLLDQDGLKELGRLLGTEIPTEGADDNIMWDCVDSLDASYQLRLAPTFRLLATEELEEQAFKRLFKMEPFAQAPSAIDPAHLLVFPGPQEREVGFAIPVPDPGMEGHQIIGYVYQETDSAAGESRVPIFEAAIPTAGTQSGSAGLIRASWVVPKNGTWRFHLATNALLTGSSERMEDAGIDVQIKVDANWHEDQEAGFAGLGDIPGAPDEGRLLDSLKGARAGMQEALANPDLPPFVKGQLEQSLKDLEGQIEALEKRQAGGTTGDPDAPGGPDANTIPLRFPDGSLEQALLLRDRMAEDDPEDLPAGQEEMLAGLRFGIGRIIDAGVPVPDAAVTLIRSSRLATLRAGSGVPLLPLDQYIPGRDYHMGVSNGNGRFGLPHLLDGDYVLIASAPGRPRIRMVVTVNQEDQFAFELPDLSLVGGQQSGEEADEVTEDLADGQHQTEPGFVLQGLDPSLTLFDVGADGVAVVRIRLRALSGFAGPVELSVKGLPAGAKVEFSENPVVLDELTEVQVRVTPGERMPRRAVVEIEARAGDLIRKVPVSLCLATGTLVAGPRTPKVKAGGRTRLRLTWKGQGPAANIKLAGRLPAWLRIEAETIKAHPHVKPLNLRKLTVAGAEEARMKLLRVTPVPTVARPEIPVPALPPIQREPITAEKVAAVPRVAPQEGVLLGPGGWMQLTVWATAEAPAGTVKIPVLVECGNRVVEEVVELTITR